MTVSDVIRPGDKVDIKFMHELDQKNVELAKTYKSQVLDIMENGNIEISMPLEGGKLVLLPLGVRFEFIFYSMGNLYRGIGQIKERYKSENVYMLEIELKTQLEKFQRREYYRYACLLDINYYVLTEEEAQMESANVIFVQLSQEEQEEGKCLKDREKNAQTVDLSGGGIKFCTSEKLERGQYLLLAFQLISEKINKQFYILGSVISCVKRDSASGRKYEVRVKFLIDDDKVREDIIRYIFEEERKNRQRDKR